MRALWKTYGQIDVDVVVIGATIALLVLGAMEEKGVDVVKSLEKKNSFVQGTVILASILILIVFGIYRGANISSDFIYKQF